MDIENGSRPRTWWETTLAFFFGLLVLFGRGIAWLFETLVALLKAGMIATAIAAVAGVSLLVVPFLCFAWGWVAAGPLLPRDPIAGLLLTAFGALAAAIATLPWRPVEAFVSWLTSPLRRGGPAPTWLSDASRSINGFVLLFGSLVSLAHLSGYLLGFDSYLIRVVLLIAMMMTAGFANLAERNRLSHELLGIAGTNVRIFRALSLLLIVGSLTVGSYLSAFAQGTQFAVRAESRDVRLSDGTDLAVRVIPTPSGGFFLVEDVLGPFAAEKLVPGEEMRLAGGTELSLPGYVESPVAFDGGAVGWKIRRAWWLGYETRAANAPVEYGSLEDAALVARLSPVPREPPEVPRVVESKIVAPVVASQPPIAPKPVACADLPDGIRDKHCKKDDAPAPVQAGFGVIDCAKATFHMKSIIPRCKPEYDAAVAEHEAFCERIEGMSYQLRQAEGCVSNAQP